MNTQYNELFGEWLIIGADEKKFSGDTVKRRVRKVTGHNGNEDAARWILMPLRNGFVVDAGKVRAAESSILKETCFPAN
jgi:hypothetical protein